MNHLNKKNKGFTLIEILVVIGIIAILAAIVIVAINPKKHFDDAIAAQRDANVNTILNAIGQYIVDNKGGLPTIPTVNGGEIDEALCNTLVPEYVGAMPTDPQGDFDGAVITDGDCDNITTTLKVGYNVDEASDRVTVCSAIDPAICVTR